MVEALLPSALWDGPAATAEPQPAASSAKTTEASNSRAGVTLNL